MCGSYALFLGAIFGTAMLIMGEASSAFADPCVAARKDLDETAKDFLRQNREHWERAGKLLYAEYREKIDAELDTLNRDTQARLKTARRESERGAIRTSHQERKTIILKAWQEYHAEKQDLDRRFQETHFAIQDEWYAEIWQLRKTEDCGYGASRLSQALRQLLLWTAEQMEKHRRPPREPAGSGGGIRG